MSTYYYARILPTKERKEELKNLIDEDKYEDIVKVVNELYGEAMPDYNVKGAVINIGKRSGGWKFLFNANKEMYYNASLESLKEFLHRDNIIITNEYGVKFTADEFFDMALNWYPEGLDGKKYAEIEKKEHGYSTYEQFGDHEQDKFWVLKGYEPFNYEFITKDNLRWSTSSEF